MLCCCVVLCRGVVWSREKRAMFCVLRQPIAKAWSLVHDCFVRKRSQDIECVSFPAARGRPRSRLSDNDDNSDDSDKNGILEDGSVGCVCVVCFIMFCCALSLCCVVCDCVC